jgi:hypothetical protein
MRVGLRGSAVCQKTQRDGCHGTSCPVPWEMVIYPSAWIYNQNKKCKKKMQAKLPIAEKAEQTR